VGLFFSSSRYSFFAFRTVTVFYFCPRDTLSKGCTIQENSVRDTSVEDELTFYLIVQYRVVLYRARISKLLWSPGIDSTNSPSLCSLAGRYDNPIPARFLAPIDFLKIPAQGGIVQGGIVLGGIVQGIMYSEKLYRSY
jgi:hypothetical protein